MDSGIQIEGLEKMTEDMCEDEGNKNKAIKLLKKEIDSLKTKIVELEKQCGGGDTRLHQGTKEDLTTIQEQHIDEKLPSGQDDASMNYTPNIKYMKLEFKVDTFFAVGSPLGVFLTLRNIRIGIGKGKEYWGEENISEEMPACRQMFNIFHPFDPVAYRSVIVPLLH
nr:phospholipase sgr2 [Quercus suber]